MHKVPTNDYIQGQMMGMLCVIRLIRTSDEPVPDKLFDKIERMSTQSLAEYLETPEEDVILIVDRTLGAS